MKLDFFQKRSAKDLGKKTLLQPSPNSFFSSSMNSDQLGHLSVGKRRIDDQTELDKVNQYNLT